jgi:diphosphomevalonate decarboxylase
VIFWSPATLAAMEAVRRTRQEGIGCYFTIDAGPQVKVLCGTSDADAVAARLRAVPGVLRVLRCAPGAGVEIEHGEVPWR